MIEGKTKQILAGTDPGTVVLRAKDVLTGGDAARVAEISAIGTWKTTQSANVFELLRQAEVPTAFIRRFDERSLLCADCDMLPVEYVVRRFGWGSYKLRHPGGPAGPVPLGGLVVERFYKHALVIPPATDKAETMDETAARSRFLRDGVWADGVHTDPFIEVRADGWYAHPAKAPVEVGRGGHPIAAPISAESDATIVETIILPAFLALERAWRDIETEHGPVVLADCKFEIGVRRSDGAHVLADVVDNDSWRIWPGGDPAQQLDKQHFRDGAPMSLVTDSYALVTELTSRFFDGTDGSSAVRTR